MLLRRGLVTIRKWYNKDFKYALKVALLVLFASIAVGLAADFFLPFNGWWNALRSVILLPTAAAGFVVSYLLSLKMHYNQMTNDPDWVPYRARFSPLWRRRIALIIGAILLVLIYALGFQPGYTALASSIVVVGLSLIAFVRRTQKEILREELTVPDPRDTRFNNRVKEVTKEREAAAEERRKKAKLRRERIVRGKKYADKMEEEFDLEAEEVKEES